MNLTKPKKQTLLIIAIVLIAYLVLAFALPFLKNGRCGKWNENRAN